jgi:hypothetical protein
LKAGALLVISVVEREAFEAELERLGLERG